MMYNFKKIKGILIKDVTGLNAGYMLELSKAGYPPDSFVDCYTYSSRNNACYFNDCVAYVGETCEFVFF